MRIDDLDYNLPEGRIAQRPVEPRDSSRLMVLDRPSSRITSARFADLVDLLEPGDLLVANDSRVIPARLLGRKSITGGAVELLLLTRIDDRTWRALVNGRARNGTSVLLGEATDRPVVAHIVTELPDGLREIRFDRPIDGELDVLGCTPLPPYIKEPLSDAERYQTVYASVSGSAAAPTAGLHFTAALIDRLEHLGVRFAFVTLHVGLDTFRPVSAERVADHVIHSEWAQLPDSTARAVRTARGEGKRVVAVGTTSVRVLETAAAGAASGRTIEPFEGWTDLFITPGHEFRAVDAMITNFHLPRTTLLLLVAAFAGRGLMDRAYELAIDDGYRFYSFGDAMFIR